MYEVGLTRAFRAFHVMPGMEGPEGKLHHHDYRLEVSMSAEELDERGMVVDLDELEAAVDKSVGIVENKDLEIIRPSDARAVTVEVLARWAHSEISARIGDGPRMLSVRIWESPVAFGGYTAPVASSS